MTFLHEFPFDSGLQEGADKKLLPAGALRRATNAVLRRDGSIEVRPKFTALSMTAYPVETLTATDLGNYNDRLIALGSIDGDSDPTDLFELVSGVRNWRGSGLGNTVSFTRIPQATDLRDIEMLPDQVETTDAVRCAYLSGYVATVHQQESSATFHVVSSVTGQTLLQFMIAVTKATVIAVGSSFWFIGIDGGDEVAGRRFRPATDTSVPGPTTLFAGGDDIDAIHASPIPGTTTFNVAIARDTPAVFIRRFSEAGVTAATITGPTDATFALQVQSATGGQTSLLRVASTGVVGEDVELSTWNAADVLFATTVIFGGDDCPTGRATLAYDDGDTRLRVAATFVTTGSQTEVRFAIFTDPGVSHTPSTSQVYHDAMLATDLLSTGDETVWAYTNAGLTNQIVDYSGAGSSRNARVLCQKDQTLAALTEPGQLNGLAYDSTTKTLYWGTLFAKGVSFAAGRVSSLKLNSSERRQHGQIGDHYYISGALPLVYDGVSLSEQGFAERPRFVSATASNGSGSLPSDCTIFVALVYRYTDSQGAVHYSAPSLPREVTMGASDDTITIVCPSPHTMRSTDASTNGTTVTVEAYRTLGDGEVLQRVESVTVPSTHELGQTVTIVLETSDATMEGLPTEYPPIYTEAQTPLPHHAPQPHSYMWPGRERIAIAGLPRPSKWVQSKLLFPNEPIEHAFEGQLGFEGRTRGPIRAVLMLDQELVGFTRREIFAVGGEGPGHNGQGDFFAGARVSNAGGIVDWRSLVETDEGAMFQLDPDKIYMLGKGGGLEWVGQPVRDTLELFPVITAAVYVRAQNLVAFAVQASNGLTGGVLTYDLRRKQWFFWDEGVISAMSEADGRLCIIKAGVVYQQDTAPGTGTSPVMTLETGMISGDLVHHMGYGDIFNAGVLFEYRGAATLQCLIDRDDGAGFVACGDPSSVSISGLTAGDARVELWAPDVVSGQRFALRFVMTPATDSPGLRLNKLALETDQAPYIARLPAAQQR